jgi:RNA polymerase sigma factor (sigma-70 family)
MQGPLDIWFEREILAHEGALVRYLTRIWPNRDEVHDLRQEIYIRVYEAAARSRPHAAKSFLFTTARNLLADRIRRERIVSIEAVGDLEVLDVLIDEVSPERRIGARQELKRVAQAFDRLSPKCRRVFWMRRVEQLTQKEVANALRIHEKTVEKHLAKGVRLIADYLFGSKSTSEAMQAEATDTRNGRGHGKHQD